MIRYFNDLLGLALGMALALGPKEATLERPSMSPRQYSKSSTSLSGTFLLSLPCCANEDPADAPKTRRPRKALDMKYFMLTNEELT